MARRGALRRGERFDGLQPGPDVEGDPDPKLAGVGALQSGAVPQREIQHVAHLPVALGAPRHHFVERRLQEVFCGLVVNGHRLDFELPSVEMDVAQIAPLHNVNLRRAIHHLLV
eukprot:CAMPEP_0180179886 /NCGR_PEP_ID=MMETSP0986-20121125/39274_1 /TAXON_ID=697907 /ORGANISM="non described non described, Strain CCMP2293" /LENGTH=113 /DNA_ID=CAMNT_0022133023 /DNA_START=48 /DNA_END=389 /DNA_ORIENTATION=+